MLVERLPDGRRRLMFPISTISAVCHVDIATVERWIDEGRIPQPHIVDGVKHLVLEEVKEAASCARS